ncbi:DUF4394 domain-containing protein [Hymenobacter perfusus]|uniref:DUF4394 domain-containing protein n=1 Tax=Hymenobacter perfusus TaxID=1236770 RepID=A0A3R9MGZ1_9BACT|nr:DUF4394 domain-containing protein [Hymenobacter perfusus]RSK45652.1 DUF4394 domain-containing protein [Hymenobacter perfusus]
MFTLSTRRGGLLLGALGLLGLSSASAQTVYGLSSTSSPAVVNLVSFNAAAPSNLASSVAITGFTAGQAIVGIDFRPNTGELFALGYNPTGTQAQLYTINRTTGAVTAVGNALTLDLGTNILRIGFDFNPTVDRIRVTGGNRANFRLNPNNGALAFTDGTLTYAPTDANAAQIPGVGSSAYTNSFIGATSTTLYNLDEANNRLVSQSPPNDGTLNTLGTLSIPINSQSQLQATDLDIYFNATTGTNTAYLSVATASSLTTLYTINLANGATTQVGDIGVGSFVAITDIAFAIDRPATLPAVTGQLAYALAGTNLLTFDTNSPGTIRTSVGLTGVATTQTVVGMDVRPLNGALYALGYNATAQTGQLYTINATTGVATAISSSLSLPLGTGSIGFDFNPTVDRIRIVGANRANFRINPNDGTAAPTVDGTITYATTDANAAATPALGSVAYTNSFPGGADAARTTTLFGYDEALNVLVRQDPPNAGTLNTIGASGVTVTAGPNVDIDIFSPAAGTNTAYLVAASGTSANSSLYSLNLTTGAATAPVLIGNGIAVRDLAVAPATGVTTGVRQPDVATGFSLYPNPVTDAARVTFRLPRAGQAELILTDALGRTVERKATGSLTAGSHTLDWQPANRRAGVYFLRLTVDGESAGTQRVLVQ